VITAIAWIGSSFYFVFLDNSLTPPTSPDLKAKGVDGELWAVHGGGFYNPQKYMVAPKKMPHNLHWFYWESYSTWLTGFALFTVLYLFNAGTFLIDKTLLDWSPGAAVAPRRWASGGVLAGLRRHLPRFGRAERRPDRRRAGGAGGGLRGLLGWPASCLRAAPPSCWWAR
jgi:hypothetical protein